MSVFLLSAAAFVLATVAFGLWRILRGPSDVDRMLAPELLGTGGIAALLLLGTATGETAVADLAMLLALLAVFTSVAFASGAGRPGAAKEPEPTPARERIPDQTPESAPEWPPERVPNPLTRDQQP